VVYKRYASLYFVAGIDVDDNELITLEIIHHFVEVLDRYFGNVCELDLIFNFHKVQAGGRRSSVRNVKVLRPLRQ
jgi:Clathrin adaptor complex small chain